MHFNATTRQSILYLFVFLWHTADAFGWLWCIKVRRPYNKQSETVGGAAFMIPFAAVSGSLSFCLFVTYILVTSMQPDSSLKLSEEQPLWSLLLQLVVCVRATFAVVNVALKLSSILVLVAIQLTGLSCTIHLQSEIRLIPNCWIWTLSVIWSNVW